MQSYAIFLGEMDQYCKDSKYISVNNLNVAKKLNNNDTVYLSA